MSSGTKISLAIIALVVGVLVVYYGVIMPGDDGENPVMVSSSEGGESAAPPPAAAPRLIENGAPLTPRDTPTIDPVDPPVPQDGRAGAAGAAGSGAVDRAPGAVVREPAVDFTGTRASDPRTGNAGRGAGASAKGVLPERDPAAPVTEPRPAARPLTPAAPAPVYVDYVVEDGDTMSSIALDWLGDAERRDLIAKANPLVDPNRLREGMTLRLPPPERTTGTVVHTEQGRSAKVHRVRSGETLSSIAEAYYGAAAKWRLIYDANRAVIGADPDQLGEGDVLRIPPVS